MFQASSKLLNLVFDSALLPGADFTAPYDDGAFRWR
jgi:hypothetical protein